MPKWLTGLVTVTCIAVLGYVGDQLWQQHQTAELNAESATFQAHRESCFDDLNRYYADLQNGALKGLVTSCITDGYLGKDDIDDANHKLGL